MGARLFVVDSELGDRTPFLRGILVQSLVALGLSFPDAYDLTQHIRGLLDKEGGPVEKARLRDMVAAELEQRFGAQTRLAYTTERPRDGQITVRTGTREEAFSVGVLTRHLEGCGIRFEEATRGAHLVQSFLRERADPVIDHRELRRIVFETLSQRCCAEAAHRYLSRCHLRDSGVPLILLIGGATGAGKSTVATRLAYLLDIVRTQSTDMMREIIRCYLVPHVAPTLGYSSFDAWRGLPGVDARRSQPESDDLVVSGFLAQFGTVKVALEATIARAVKEQHDLIIDGVHVLPSRLDLAAIGQKALIVPMVLAVTTRGRLDDHLLRRGREQPRRDSEHHRRTLDEIWRLQAFMVDQAERNGIPVIATWGLDETVASVMDEVVRQIGIRFPPRSESLK